MPDLMNASEVNNRVPKKTVASGTRGEGFAHAAYAWRNEDLGSLFIPYCDSSHFAEPAFACTDPPHDQKSVRFALCGCESQSVVTLTAPCFKSENGQFSVLRVVACHSFAIGDVVRNGLWAGRQLGKERRQQNCGGCIDGTHVGLTSSFAVNNG